MVNVRQEPSGVRPGGLIAVPQPDTEIDQRAAEFDAAFPADATVSAASGGFVLHRGQPRRPVQLAGPGHRGGSPTAAP